MWTGTGIRTCSSSTARAGRASRLAAIDARLRRSTATIATARSPTSRSRRGWRSRCTVSARPPRISTTTVTSNLLITALGGNKLFRNTGKGTFADVTAKSGVGGPASAFPASAAWVDYDRDGRLDLVVLHYVQWSIAQDKFCSLDGKNKSYCTPETYKGESPTLYRNRGDGTFQDVTKAAGLYDPTSKALGVALIDYNDDGWLGSVRGERHGAEPVVSQRGRRRKFVDEAIAAGVAFNEAGVARAGMGVDAADYDGSGRDSLVIGNFTNEMIALYHNEGGNLFLDKAPGGTIGRASMSSLTFSCFFFDFDLDGRPDIFAANGHVADDISKSQPKITHAQAPLLFRNAGGQKFDVGRCGKRAEGADGRARRGVRGLSICDGDPDIAVNVNGGPARLFRNDGGSRSHALRLTLAGVEVEPLRDRRARHGHARQRREAARDGQDRVRAICRRASCR